jgi:hypothetical protein
LENQGREQVEERRIMKESMSFKTDQTRSLPRSIVEGWLRVDWASVIPWSLLRQILLPFVAIYLIGGAIIFNIQLLEFFDCATPITVGGAALLIAFLAKLILREEF